MNASALAAANKELKSKFPDVDILEMEMNVQNTADVKRSIAETVKRFGRLDVAVNNAGIGGSGRKTHEIEEEEWLKVVDVDLHGVWRCQREQIAVMLKQE
jgi:NAD(P)-dependent dehydrogenase (short-subunit alcohol dehydrogenase family)